MKSVQYLGAALCAALLLASPAKAETLCTIIADAITGDTLVEEGDCATRFTPASTFKVPLAVMGFDAGFLKSATEPELPFKPGYPDMVESWRQPTDPIHWLEYSVVWYSQRITEVLGQDELERYARGFGLGNADFSGDPGQNNGLERAWLSSSLLISPREQIAFWRRLIARDLPVAPDAIDMTLAIVEQSNIDGWVIHGKTGSAWPRHADGSFDRARPWAWFVGFAEKGGRQLVFARINQDERRTNGQPGTRARGGFLTDWTAYAADIGL